MAKDDKKKAAPPKGDKVFRFGVADLAKRLGLEPASVRVKLRNAEIEKDASGVYGWNDQKEFDKVVKALDSGTAEKADKPKPKVKAAGTEKPKPKAKVKA